MFFQRITHICSVFILLLVSSTQSLASDKFYIEAIAESDDSSELYGFNFITYINPSVRQWSPYVGGGLVHVNLVDADESFVALHAVSGADFMLTRNFGFTAELGIDLGEELISGEDERGNPTVGGDENNAVDINFSAGLTFKLQQQLYIKAYVRRHYFDGVFLPDTNVTFIGARLGLAF